MRLVLIALLLSLPLIADELPAEARQVLDAYVKALEARNTDEMWELCGERLRAKVVQRMGPQADRTKWLTAEAARLMADGGDVEVKEVILGATVSIAHVKFPGGPVVSLRFGREDGVMKVIDSDRVANPYNEVIAQSALKQIVSTEGVWRQCDSDMNGSQDYWTLDVAGFYYRLDSTGTHLKYVDVSMARADRAGLAAYAEERPEPKGGYWLRVMVTDETGERYRQDPDGDGAENTNPSKYGFCAYPVEYGVSGTMTYIINEEGVVYEKDLGADAKEGCETWPDADPMSKGWVASE